MNIVTEVYQSIAQWDWLAIVMAICAILVLAYVLLPEEEKP
jgi:hypothetical protein